jgi:formiminotetrahydrofolate cyclodeaminase
MVARLTVGKPAYAAVHETMEQIIPRADRISARFLKLMEEDAQAYHGVIAARKLPKATDEEREARNQAVEAANRRAAEIPLETLRLAGRLAEEIRTVMDSGNPHCITDAGTAAHLIRTAAYAAAYNVRINLDGAGDPSFADNCRNEMKEILGRITRERIDPRLESLFPDISPVADLAEKTT